MNRLLFTVLSTIFLLANDVLATPIKMSYQVPVASPSRSGELNQIIQVGAYSNVVVIIHRLGVSISQDGGETFQESDIALDQEENSVLRSGFGEVVHFNRETSEIFLDFNRGLYKSVDNGKSFKRIKDERIGEGGWSSLSTMGQKMAIGYYEEYCEGGHRGHNDNYFYKSLDSGATFEEQLAGSSRASHNPRFDTVFFYNGYLYIKGGEGYFKSDDLLLKNFTEITKDEWDRVYSANTQQIEYSIISTDLGNSVFPEQKLKITFNHLRKIQYLNSDFNENIRRQNILYRYTLRGNLYIIDSEDMPRYASYDPTTRTVYYASYAGLWKSKQ